jgi:protein ImuB
VTVAEAAGLPATAPVAVMTGHRVVACSAAARAEGVRTGQRRREAQARCPGLETLPRSPDLEAHAFEPVTIALESVVPGVEVVRPGLVLVGAAGPARYFGGEAAALDALYNAACPHVPDVHLGVADGPFAAEMAARDDTVIVPAGGSARFLAPLPISRLEADPAMTELFFAMGLHTLGDLAALSASDVLARFGPVGATAHRRAGGEDARPVSVRLPPTDLTATLELAEPVERVDTMAFTAAATVERFLHQLGTAGLACTCVEVELRAEDHTESVRRWRHAGILTAAALLDRLRWQLEGWRTGPTPPTGGVDRLRLIPVESVPAGVNQEGLWGGTGARDERAHRAVARVQSLLGPSSVLLPVVAGGRLPAERSQLVPWGEDPAPERSVAEPWPGRLPAPAPSVLLDPPRPVRVLDARGGLVRVTDRGGVPSPPAALDLGDGPVQVTGWAGPWPVDERWWDAAAASGRMALFQLVDVAGRAYLACCRVDPVRWTLDAVYD